MKKYIIFGAGRYGEEALLYYGLANVAYFCDNKKYGSVIKGIEVISFEKLCEIWKDYEVVLAVWAAGPRTAMIKQLEDWGIEYSSFTTLDSKLQDGNFDGEYQFINRSKGCEKLLIVLAGYKQYLWDSVFSRIKKYVPSDMDICVLTAGYANEELRELCEKEEWSYLYTTQNKLALVQNFAIREHVNAKWIYKMDEDIFVTEGLFEELMDTYQTIEGERKYFTGFVAPLMNVNNYGYRRILEYLDCVEEYQMMFDDARVGGGVIFGNPQAAEYMWNKTLPVDGFADKLRIKEEKYSICHHRYSIGCILISRDIWNAMGGFKNAPEGVLGIDEEHLCQWCMNNCKAILIAERAYAGHFSYGPQTEHMKKMYEKRREEFDN